MATAHVTVRAEVDSQDFRDRVQTAIAELHIKPEADIVVDALATLNGVETRIGTITYTVREDAGSYTITPRDLASEAQDNVDET